MRETAAQLYERTEGTAGAELSDLSRGGPIGACARWRRLAETGWNPEGGGGFGGDWEGIQTEHKTKNCEEFPALKLIHQRESGEHADIEVSVSLAAEPSEVHSLSDSLAISACFLCWIDNVIEGIHFHKRCDVFEWNVITRSEICNHRVAFSV